MITDYSKVPQELHSFYINIVKLANFATNSFIVEKDVSDLQPIDKALLKFQCQALC